jgi:hypothetical protein
VASEAEHTLDCLQLRRMRGKEDSCICPVPEQRPVGDAETMRAMFLRAHIPFTETIEVDWEEDTLSQMMGAVLKRNHCMEIRNKKGACFLYFDETGELEDFKSYADD